MTCTIGRQQAFKAFVSRILSAASRFATVGRDRAGCRDSGVRSCEEYGLVHRSVLRRGIVAS
jgi:hypothetical protein